MRIVLIGDGKMGKAVREIALNRGHEIVNTISSKSSSIEYDANNPDLAIEFTKPEAALNNILQCLKVEIPVISGTTGWTDDIQKVIDYCLDKDGTFFYAPNFSIGVNIFLELNRNLARIMSQHKDFSAKIKETHHIHKKDVPSGTAIRLAEDMLENMNEMDGWVLGESSKNEIGIVAHREDEVPGSHQITFENQTDIIRLQHEAKNRIGFATGVILVGEWLLGKNGFFTMKDFLDH